MNPVLVGVDLSPESQAAATLALGLARHKGAPLVLVMASYVPESIEGLPSGMHPIGASYAQRVADVLAADRKALGELRERLSGQGVEVSQLVVDGRGAESLARVAEEMSAQLVIVGTHGRTGIKRWWLGSVAERTARLSPCSVLVARGDFPAHGFERIVVGMDFSPHAFAALAEARRLVAPGGHIDVLHCWQMPLGFAPPDGPVTLVPQELEVALVKELDESCRAFAEASRREGIHVSLKVIEDSPASGLEQWAKEHHAQLAVTGSHGRRGFRRWVIGSVAETVVRHAPCSVLVVHHGDSGSQA
jgi:nucleotide-binding universal stress UspA family protein